MFRVVGPYCYGPAPCNNADSILLRGALWAIMPTGDYTMYHVWILSNWPYGAPVLFECHLSLSAAKYFRRALRAIGQNAVIV